MKSKHWRLAPARLRAASLVILVLSTLTLALPLSGWEMAATAKPQKALTTAGRPRGEAPVPQAPAKSTAGKPSQSKKAAAPKRAKRKARRIAKVHGSFSTSRSCLPESVKSKLAEIERRWGKVRIVSTFRKGAVIAGSGKTSMHAHCRAVDFHPPKGRYKQVLNYLKKNHSGGLGTYSCAMHHLHLDNGPNVRWHHCVNKRGRPVRQAKK